MFIPFMVASYSPLIHLIFNASNNNTSPLWLAASHNSPLIHLIFLNASNNILFKNPPWLVESHNSPLIHHAPNTSSFSCILFFPLIYHDIKNWVFLYSPSSSWNIIHEEPSIRSSKIPTNLLSIPPQFSQSFLSKFLSLQISFLVLESSPFFLSIFISKNILSLDVSPTFKTTPCDSHVISYHPPIKFTF